jgi:tetratricopeptide (TPR) repeat protein
MAREEGVKSDLEESLKIFRSLNDEWGTALPLYGIGYWMLIQEMFEAAKAQLEISLATRRELGDQWLIGQNLNYLGEVVRCLGDYQQAEHCYQESLNIFEVLGSQGRVAMSIHNLGYIALHQSDYLLAQTRFQQAHTLFQQLEDHYGSAACLEGMAAIMARENEPEASIKLILEAQSIRGTVSFTTTPADRREYANTCAIIQSQLGEQRWLAAWKTGTIPRIETAMADE